MHQLNQILTLILLNIIHSIRNQFVPISCHLLTIDGVIEMEDWVEDDGSLEGGPSLSEKLGQQPVLHKHQTALAARLLQVKCHQDDRVFGNTLAMTEGSGWKSRQEISRDCWKIMTLPSSSMAATPEPLSSRPPVLATVSQWAPTTSTLSPAVPHILPGNTPMMLVPGRSPELWRWTNCRALNQSVHKWSISFQKNLVFSWVP